MYSGHFPVQLTHLSSWFRGIFLYHVICSVCFYCSESPWANAWLPVFHSSHAVSTCSLALGRKGTPLGVSLFLSVCSWLLMLWLKLQKGPASVPCPQLCISSTSTLAWPTWTPSGLPCWWFSAILADEFFSVSLIVPLWPLLTKEVLFFPPYFFPNILRTWRINTLIAWS